MKNIISLLVVLLSTTLAISQSCSTYYPLTKDATFQITNYTNGDTPSAIIDYLVTDVTKKGNRTIGTITSTSKDGDGQLVVENSFNVFCENATFSMDMESMVDKKATEQYKDMNLRITSTTIDYPNTISIGQTLKGATIKMTMDIAGSDTSIDMNIVDRKVVDKESVTTPAGTFTCYLLTHTTNYNIPSLNINDSFSSKVWIAKGPGIVKQEDYNNEQLLINKSLLTQFNQPSSKRKLQILHN